MKLRGRVRYVAPRTAPVVAAGEAPWDWEDDGSVAPNDADTTPPPGPEAASKPPGTPHAPPDAPE